jgi:general transcription factor 3C polypeptide 1
VLRVSYARQSHLKERNSALTMQKEPRANSRLTYQRKKRSANEITLKFIKQKTQMNGAAEQISDKSALIDKVPDRFSPLSTDLEGQSDMVVSRCGSPSKYHEDEDAEGSPMISRTILRKSFMRTKRFLWTYESDR